MVDQILLEKESSTKNFKTIFPGEIFDSMSIK